MARGYHRGLPMWVESWRPFLCTPAACPPARWLQKVVAALPIGALDLTMLGKLAQPA